MQNIKILPCQEKGILRQKSEDSPLKKSEVFSQNEKLTLSLYSSISS